VLLGIALKTEEMLARSPRTLWKYGLSMRSLRYSVGRESTLPCAKSDIRESIRMAIGLSRDADVRARLSAGYVQLEVFLTDAEFEIVKEMQDREGAATPLLPKSLPAFNQLQTVDRTEGANSPAAAILTRIASQMLARRRELRGHS
jgi:hypothetical protein